ncbi:DUF4416 family protein [Persephonella sp.]
MGLEALLGFALMWREDKNLNDALYTLGKDFGNILIETEPFYLPYSKYYEKEMGKGVRKKFVFFSKLINKLDIKNIKKYSMALEDKFRIDGNRTVNIDPLYLDIDQVVVSTSKYRGNRIYLGDGVFVELELWYHHGSFQPFLWTYLDYKEKIPFFNKVRNLYRKLYN